MRVAPDIDRGADSDWAESRKDPAKIASAAVVALLILSAYLSMMPEDNEAAKVNYIAHNTISINGDAEFDNSCYPDNGVVSGNGSASDPYVIEGWNISASSAHGIYIQNSNVHFIVRDCYVHGGGGSYQGIYISGCTNGTICNNTCSGDQSGVRLHFCDGMQVHDNICQGNYYDIYLFYSDNIIVSGNSCFGNGEYGIYSDNSLGNVFFNNSCSGKQYYGIMLKSSSGTLYNNTCFNNSDGIRLEYSDYSIIYNNRFFNNSGRGIALVYSCDNDWVVNNSCCDNGLYGIYLLTSRNNTISNNNCTNNTDGINLVSSSNNTIWNNTFIGNGAGYQGYDDGTTNHWNSSSGYGNWWDDWQTPDSNGDGIVDVSYAIGGGSNEDEFPLTEKPLPPPFIPEFSSASIPILCLMLLALFIGRIRRRVHG